MEKPMYSKNEYQRAFESFMARNPLVWPRYQTAHSDELLFAFLIQQQQPASTITVELAIKQLVAKNLLVRVDGKSQSDDTQEALNKIIQEIEAPELAALEIEAFSSIHPQELMERYWEDNGTNRFAIRYRKAAKTFGFQIPGRPAAKDTVAAGNEVELTAEVYNAMPARELQVRLRDPRFKAGVYRLLAERKIA
jgi:hypothetical protein